MADERENHNQPRDGLSQQVILPKEPLPEWPAGNPFANAEASVSEKGSATAAFPSNTLTVTAHAINLPFIPPSVLAEYETVRPGMGDKLIEWTERQQNHRMSLEDRAQIRTLDRQDRTQKGSFAIALMGLILAAIVGYHGEEWASAIIAIVSIGGPVAATVLAGRFHVGVNRQPRLPPVPAPNTQAPAAASETKNSAPSET